MRSIVTYILLSAFLLAGMSVYATHNRAAEIIYCHLGGLSYEVTIITHTKTTSPANRDSLEINWGDNSTQWLQRSSVVPFPNPLDAQENRYMGIHLYAGPGIYNLSFNDPNRNGGVLNIPNSIGEPMCVNSQLTIGPQTISNCSVRFLNAPLQDACSLQPWIHNSVAFDPDGDSLSYELVACRGAGCLPIPGYEFPDETQPAANTFTIDAQTGTLSWLNPQLTGEYNLAFKVSEWRNGLLVGWVVRDMQLTVFPCNNIVPNISAIADTCVLANSALNITVSASDPNVNDDLSLNAQGEPFNVSGPAVFIPQGSGNPISGNFTWTPDCDRVRLQPYQVVFTATDDATSPDIALTNLSTFNITVIAPAVTNPTATPVLSNIELAWDASICTNATAYKIFRRVDPVGYQPGDCETGVPTSTGYTQIGTTSGHTSTLFTDNGPLNYGQQYCYMIVACFADGAESQASDEFCASLNREAPVVTNVTVDNTDISSGQITVRWENALELDTVQFPGPYFFEVERSDAGLGTYTTVHTTTTFPFLIHPDTFYVDQNINTESLGHSYLIELHNNSGLISVSSEASSLFLQVLPGDEKNDLVWSNDVPWTNTSFDVYREDSPGTFVLIGTSSSNSYTDTLLSNGVEYCYYVESTGSYNIAGISSPLINLSQVACGTPIDLTPPCPPDLVLDNDCEAPLNTLTWNNPNNSCSSDNAGYNIYFSPFQDSTLQLIANNENPSDTVFLHTNGSSVSGCYAISAVDSSGNESELSNVVCGENCPLYELPNIITPNGDDMNDRFIPLIPYRGVEKIDLTVFNRWGNLVFRTEDPAINWNGDHFETGEQVSDGTYFYICKVEFPNLQGIEIIELTGNVTILQNRGNPNQ